MRTPARWYGAKRWLLKYIMPLPSHHTYVEAFGGAGTLLFEKEPSPVEVYNDIDLRLVNFFRMLRDEHQAAVLVPLLELTPYSRDEYISCRNACQKALNGEDFEQHGVEWARRFFVAMHQSFSGLLASGWRHCKVESTRGKSAAVDRWLGAIDRLPEAVQRLREVQIEGQDFSKIIPQYDRKQALFYLDPPYVPEKRVDQKSYGKNEMKPEDHEELVALLLQLNHAMVIVSGYNHPIYHPLVREGWTRRTVTRANMAARVKKGKERKRGVKEALWFSPNYPEEFIH